MHLGVVKSVIWIKNMSIENKNPELPFLHMHTDPDGKSAIVQKMLTSFKKESVGGKADPQWMLSFPGKVADVKFAVLPEGWMGDWHESPTPQWVIPTKGRWFIETQNGNRIEMGPGDIHFGQDTNTVEINGKVLISELSGSESLIHFTNGNLNWVSLSNGIQQKNIGENTKLFMNVDEFLYFDENNILVNHG